MVGAAGESSEFLCKLGVAERIIWSVRAGDWSRLKSLAIRRFQADRCQYILRKVSVQLLTNDQGSYLRERENPLILQQRSITCLGSNRSANSIVARGEGQAVLGLFSVVRTSDSKAGGCVERKKISLLAIRFASRSRTRRMFRPASMARWVCRCGKERLPALIG